MYTYIYNMHICKMLTHAHTSYCEGTGPSSGDIKGDRSMGRMCDGVADRSGDGLQISLGQSCSRTESMPTCRKMVL